MQVSDLLRRIHIDIATTNDVTVDLQFKSDTEFSHIFDKADWFGLHDGEGNGYICMNDELFNDLTTTALVNILCHEWGHILDKERTPIPMPGTATLEGVIACERAANIIGESLFNQYMPKYKYWHNHEDVERMKSSTRFYNGREVHKPGLPKIFYKREVLAAY